MEVLLERNSKSFQGEAKKWQEIWDLARGVSSLLMKLYIVG